MPHNYPRKQIEPPRCRCIHGTIKPLPNSNQVAYTK